MAETRKITIWKAIVIGQLVVNLPAVGIMFAALFLGSFVAPRFFALLGSISRLDLVVIHRFTLARLGTRPRNRPRATSEVRFPYRLDLAEGITFRANRVS